MWILFTLLAAFMQAWRNAFQKQLSVDVNVLGRDAGAFYLRQPAGGACIYGCYIVSQRRSCRSLAAILFYVVAASLMQILATALMVVLFKQKNYAIGVGLAKSEAIFAAVLGVLFFASSLTPLGWFGVLLGSLAVFLLSGLSSIKTISWPTVADRLGLGPGFCADVAYGCVKQVWRWVCHFLMAPPGCCFLSLVYKPSCYCCCIWCCVTPNPCVLYG